VILTLRRRHRGLWLVLALLLPLLYVAFLLARPKEPRIEALPEVLLAPLVPPGASGAETPP
jgi:hypothetical protein